MSLRRLSLTILMLVVAGTTRPATGFDLPGVGTFLGTENPLAVLPDSLGRTAASVIEYEVREFYRYRRGDERQEYTYRSVRSAALVRSGPLWLGARYGENRLSVLQRGVHGMDDALDGRTGGEHLAAAGIIRHAGWESRILVGGSRGQGEGAVEVRAAPGPLSRLRVRAWIWHASLELSQRVDATTFHFGFPYRDESFEIEAATRSLLGHRLELRAGRTRIVGQRLDPDQYGLLYIDSQRGEIKLLRLAFPRLDLGLQGSAAGGDVALALGGTRYAEAHDLTLRRWGAEMGWRPQEHLRVAGGVERWRFWSNDPSFVDLWPFTVWDVFTATRFRLVEMEKNLRTAYARATWTPPPWGRVSLALDGRFEWWEDDGYLHWKQRVPVLPPFFFTYEHHVESLDWPFTHAAQLDGTVVVRAGRNVRLRVHGRLQFPFGDDSGGDSPDPRPPDPVPAATGPDTSVRGGLSLRTGLDLAW